MSSKYNKYITLVLFCWLVIAVQGKSQDPVISATAPASVTLGQAFNYTISGDFSGDVELPSLKGFRLAGGPSTFVSQQSSFVNGKVEYTKTVSYTYTLLAQEEGDLVIPSATIRSGRKTFMTNEVRIRVVKSAPAASQPTQNNNPQKVPLEDNTGIFIRQIPSKNSVFLGEQLVLSTKIYTQEALNISDFKAPGFDGFWRQDLDADQNALQENVNGRTYLTQVFKRDLLTPQKTGSLTIDAANLTCVVRKKLARNRSNVFGDPFFDDPFFDRYENVPQEFNTNTLSVNVKPLPENAPSGFTGAVGNFSFKAGIDKQNLNVNDAITLKVHITGNGNLELLKPVKIDFPPDLEVFDPKSVQKIEHRLDGTSGSVDYEYVVIPRHAGNYRISPVIFSWFDPKEEKYKTAKTSEFTFSVEKSGNEDEAYITSPGTQALINQGGKEVKTLAGDIQFIRITPPELRPSGKALFGSASFISAFLIPVIIVILLIILRRERIRRNADINAVRNRKASRLAEKRLKSASLRLKAEDSTFYDEILKAIWGYLSDKLGINVSELSRDRITEELDKINLDTGTRDSLYKILNDCELARYASGTADKQQIYEDAVRLISILQEKIS